MSTRTRLAFIAILLLIGWVLVAPHYRSSADPADSGADQTAPPLLQLQRVPSGNSPGSEIPPWSGEIRTEADRDAAFPAAPFVSESDRSLDMLPRFKSNVSVNAAASAERKPTHPVSPRAGLVPRTHVNSTSTNPPVPATHNRPLGSLKPTPIGQPVEPLPEMKPVTLIFDDIGIAAVGSSANAGPQNLGAPGQQKAPSPSDASNGPRKSTTLEHRLQSPFGRVKSVGANAQREGEVVDGSDVWYGERDASAQPDRIPQTFRTPPARSRAFSSLGAVDQQLRPGSMGRDVVRSQWHRVVDGDSLQSIAQAYLGSPEYALLIFEANRHTLISPTILPLGAELRIPGRGEGVTR